MLNENGVRELAYVVKIDSIEPILGSDHCEAAIVGGWKVMVKKEQFNVGDLAVYFEIDSKLPEREPFMFLEKNHFKIKTQKYKFGGKNPEGFYSQGLLMSLSDINLPNAKEGDFLTKKLGVTYADISDQKRKSNNPDSGKKYQRMMNRYPKLARSKFGKWCMKHNFAKVILYRILGGDRKYAPLQFPYWVVKTDEERVQNCFNYVYNLQNEWIATEKRDGTSTTITLKGHGKKQEYAVCSRNVRMETRNDGAWYEKNVYVESADKYNIRNVLEDLLIDEYEFVTIQGETFGEGIQKRDYGLKCHEFEVFNVIFGMKNGSTKRLNPIEMKKLMDKYDVPTVPIVQEHLILPNSCDEVLKLAKGEAVKYGGMREGLVFRSYDGVHSFKAVDNDFLLKYHS